MKSYFLLASLLLFSGCTIISISKPIPLDEITALESNAVQDFQLKIATQTDNLRIDIIRQTETEEDIDGECETVDVLYHPIGFDLGNGLFFDLNNNLSFRIDSLLGLQEKEDFELLIKEGKFEKRITREDNQVCTHRYLSKGGQREFCGGFVEYTTKGMRYFSRRKLLYELIQDEEITTFSYSNRFSKPLDIFAESENDFVIKRGNYEQHFTLKNNIVNLRDLYLIQANEDGSIIEIYTIGRKTNYLLYQIKINSDQIIVYNKNNFGTKLNYSSTDISITHNDNEHASRSFKRLK